MQCKLLSSRLTTLFTTLSDIYVHVLFKQFIKKKQKKNEFSSIGICDFSMYTDKLKM